MSTEKYDYSKLPKSWGVLNNKESKEFTKNILPHFNNIANFRWKRLAENFYYGKKHSAGYGYGAKINFTVILTPDEFLKLITINQTYEIY